MQLDTLHDRQTVYQLHDAFCCVFLVFHNEITKKSVYYCTRAKKKRVPFGTPSEFVDEKQLSLQIRVRGVLFSTMKHSNNTLNIAKILRKNMTPQEKKLWNILRNNQFYGYKFKRQVPIDNYVVDFVCELQNLIIEIDGGQHNSPENIVNDNERTKYLISKGYKIIRFWNNEIDNNLNDVCAAIYSNLKNN